MPWTSYIRIEQLSEDYQLIARVLGLELTVKLANELKSVHLYLKHPDRLFQAAKEQYVLDQVAKHPGIDRRRLALDTGLSERHIYDILNDAKEKAKQQSLFS
ncbi:MAG TPA: hypothetical protein VF795_00860 [Desulfuromonadaceae bacterium]